MSLDTLRSSIEDKDHAIITLIAERMSIVEDIAREKNGRDFPFGSLIRPMLSLIGPQQNPIISAWTLHPSGRYFRYWSR
jgi:Chorismate mutase